MVNGDLWFEVCQLAIKGYELWRSDIGYFTLPFTVLCYNIYLL